MSSSEEDSTQSESILSVASGSVPDSKGQNGDDNELSQLSDTVAKKEAEKKKLIEAENKRLREQLDKSTQEVEVLKSKKQKKGTRKAELTINTLRSDKKLKSKVASQLHKLALKDDGSDSEYDTACTDSSFNSDSDSDSESDYLHSKKSRSSEKKKHKKSKSKRSGIKSKASNKVQFPQKWPHANLQFEFVNKNVAFTDLSFSLLVAGELQIIAHSKSLERRGRTALLKKIAYCNTTYSIEGLKKFYSACLRQVEKGEKSWLDDFSTLEQPILSKHLLPAKTPFKKKFTSTIKASAKSDEGSDRPWFCSLFNRNKCLHKSDHTLVSDNGQMKYALHICAACWQADKKKLPHQECSKECPHSTSN